MAFAPGGCLAGLRMVATLRPGSGATPQERDPRHCTRRAHQASVRRPDARLLHLRRSAVGCGTGWVTHRLSGDPHHGGYTLGVDISDAMLEVAEAGRPAGSVA